MPARFYEYSSVKKIRVVKDSKTVACPEMEINAQIKSKLNSSMCLSKEDKIERSCLYRKHFKANGRFVERLVYSSDLVPNVSLNLGPSKIHCIKTFFDIWFLMLFKIHYLEMCPSE